MLPFFPPSSDACVCGRVHAERRTLRSLYMMTQGPDWKEQSGWETDDPDISCWYGVTCGEGGHVISLELVSNNLQGET